MVSANFSFWFGVLTSVLLAVGAGSFHLAGLSPDSAKLLSAWAMDIGTINSIILTALHGVSSSASGPLTGGEKK